LDILVRGHDRPEAMAQRHQSTKERSPLLGRQILLAQAEPPAASPEGGLDDLLERPLRLVAIGDDEQRRGWERRHRRSRYGRAVASSSSASIVTRITASPGSATGAAIAAMVAKRGPGRPPVSALPTRRSR